MFKQPDCNQVSQFFSFFPKKCTKSPAVKLGTLLLDYLFLHAGFVALTEQFSNGGSAIDDLKRPADGTHVLLGGIHIE